MAAERRQVQRPPAGGAHCALARAKEPRLAAIANADECTMSRGGARQEQSPIIAHPRRAECAAAAPSSAAHCGRNCARSAALLRAAASKANRSRKPIVKIGKVVARNERRRCCRIGATKARSPPRRHYELPLRQARKESATIDSSLFFALRSLFLLIGLRTLVIRRAALLSSRRISGCEPAHLCPRPPPPKLGAHLRAKRAHTNLSQLADDDNKCLCFPFGRREGGRQMVLSADCGAQSTRQREFTFWETCAGLAFRLFLALCFSARAQQSKRHCQWERERAGPCENANRSLVIECETPAMRAN